MDAIVRQSEAAENERLSNLVAQANDARLTQNDQLNDLMRPRNEVGALRRQTNGLVKLRDENRRLQEAQGKMRQKLPTLDQSETVMDEAVQMEFPREKWAFAGYANPENTIVSLAVREPQPFVLAVRKRTVANVDSMTFVDRMCIQCSAGKS